MTDNEIIKAFEDLVNNKNINLNLSLTVQMLLVDTLVVLHRQKAESERYLHSIKLLEKDVQTANAEIERLQAEADCADGYADALVEKTKSEAIKEFADRLEGKKYILPYDNQDRVVVFDDDIHNLVKEMVGDDNAL